MSEQSGPARLWHVTLTVAGSDLPERDVRAALERLNAERPFLHSMRYGTGRAELRYWEEAEEMLDAAALALRLWNEHRGTAGLPRWEVVGLEVLECDVYQHRRPTGSGVMAAAKVSPRPF